MVQIKLNKFKIHYRLLPVFSFLVLLISTSFYPVYKDTIDISDAQPGDFSWLTDFYTMSQCVSIDHFDKTPGKSYDSSGVAMTNGKYHPVNLFQYGIFCFDMYRKTKREEYKKKCIAQFLYFLDTTHYDTKEDGSIAFPYLVAWRDLKPPWYSGLAQCQGMMYLVRYYYLTKDQRALYLIKKTYNFMIKDLCDGGTLNRLSDSEAWIEEYPNSKSKAEVLNGFVTSIIALREYCHLFPGDTNASTLLEKCIATHKNRVANYDYGSGILYDLGEKQKVGPWYLKIQVIQMKQMYDLYHDILYKDLQMLWGVYAYNQVVPGMFGCLLTDTNYSVPAKLNTDGDYISAPYSAPGIQSDKVYKIHSNVAPEIRSYSPLFDGNKNTFLQFKTDTNNTNSLSVFISFNKVLEAENISMSSLTDSLNNYEMELYSRVDSSDKWKEIKIKSRMYSDRTLLQDFKQIKFSELKIAFRNLGKRKSVSITELNVSSGGGSRLSFCSHFQSEDYALDEKNKSFQLITKNVNDYVVFYKTGRTSKELQSATWKIKNGIHTPSFEIDPKEKFCRFLVIFQNTPGSKMRLVKKES